MKSLLVVSVLAVVVSTGVALQCYVCNSHTDKNCKELPPTKSGALLQDCGDRADGHKYTLCRKVEMALDMDFGPAHPSEIRVQRDCGWIEDESSEEDCYYKSGYNTRSWVCACKEDGCNSASLPSIGALVLLLPMAVLRAAF